MSVEKPISNRRMVAGAIVFVLGFLSPLLIPVVAKTDWSTGLKTFLSGVLAFGIPELFMVIAVMVMGKPGYELLKEKIGRFIKPLLPPDRVSSTRYNIGLAMFCLPLIFGLAEPYLAHYFPKIKDLPLTWHLGLDLIFVLSLFVLGGDFWDKLSGLFKYDVRAQKMS